MKRSLNLEFFLGFVKWQILLTRFGPNCVLCPTPFTSFLLFYDCYFYFWFTTFPFCYLFYHFYTCKVGYNTKSLAIKWNLKSVRHLKNLVSRIWNKLTKTKTDGPNTISTRTYKHCIGQSWNCINGLSNLMEHSPSRHFVAPQRLLPYLQQ